MRQSEVDGFLAHSHTKVFELFRRMDSDLDGQISATEMFKGFAASNFKFDMSEDEVKAFIRKVEPVWDQYLISPALRRLAEDIFNTGDAW